MTSPLFYRPLFALIIPCVIFIATICSASPQSEFYISQALERYFSLPIDAHTLSMASSDALLCRGSFCSYSNPAGLAFSNSPEIEVSLADSKISGEEFLSADEIDQVQNEGFIAGVIPIGSKNAGKLPRYGSLGLGFSRYHGNTNDPINSTPDGHRRTLAYGLALAPTIGLGYSFTFYDDQLRSNLADIHSHARFLHIFGTQVKITENWEFGGTFQLGIGQSDTEDFAFMSDGLSRPKQYSSAIALKRKWTSSALAIAADYTDLESEGNLDQFSQPVVIGGEESGSFATIRFGAEQKIFDQFLLRMGVRYLDGSYHFRRSDLAKLSGDLRGAAYSAGLGLQLENVLKGLRIEYGTEYLDFANGDWQHILSFSLKI